MKWYVLAAALVGALVCNPVFAHFPWLTMQDGIARLHFGETIADTTYKLPDAIAAAKIVRRNSDSDEAQAVETATIDTEDFIGLASKQKMAEPTAIYSKVVFGLYHGSMLEYCAVHIPARSEFARLAAITKGSLLEANAHFADGKLRVVLSRAGSGASDTKVTLMDESGGSLAEEKTNDSGEVVFDASQLKPGTYAIMFGVNDTVAKGDYEGQEYKGVSYYTTVSFTLDK